MLFIPKVRPVSYLLSTLLVVIFATSCRNTGDNYGSHKNWASWTGLVSLQQAQRDSGWAIDSNANLYIVTPAAGIHNTELESEMFLVFQRYFPRARQSQYREGLSQAFVNARQAGMDYVVYPTIRTLADQQSLAAIVKRDIKIREFSRGQSHLEILIYASQGEELVDHLKVETKGSLITVDSRKLIWPPLEAYLEAVSQFSLVRR